MRTITENQRDIPIIREPDVIVIGAGPAGFAAAIAAARAGARTLMIERFGFPGGTATAGLMACINGFRNQVEPDTTQVVRGIAEEIVLDLKGMDGLGKSPYPQKTYPTEPGNLEYSYVIDTEKFKYVVLKKCAEAGVDMLFHTWFADCIANGRSIDAVIIENKSGRQALRAPVTIDATGDGDVFARAGVDFWEAPVGDEKRMTDNLMYRIAFGNARPAGIFNCDLGLSAVVWGPAVKQQISAIDAEALSRGEVECRLQVFDDFAERRKENPGLADARVVETAAAMGIRQTRFLKGEYTLTADDAIQGRRFDDVIAISPCPIIFHYGYRRYLEHEGYDIPYRTLLPRTIDNLLVAGRCISSDQEPYESHRAMVPIMAIGQAAGVAAALSVKSSCMPRKLDILTLQRELVRQNVVLRKKP